MKGSVCPKIIGPQQMTLRKSWAGRIPPAPLAGLKCMLLMTMGGSNAQREMIPKAESENCLATSGKILILKQGLPQGEISLSPLPKSICFEMQKSNTPIT